MIKKSDRASSSAEISIVASKTDNGAVYKCEAKNPTIRAPLVDTVRLNVYCECSHFIFKQIGKKFLKDGNKFTFLMLLLTVPPESVKIDVLPSVLQVGTIARISCNSTSSNPGAEITWWRDNAIKISEGISYYWDAGQYGGNITSSELQLNVTADMHNSTITCKAINAVLKEGAYGSTDYLNVLCKYFYTSRNSMNEL